MLKTKITSMLGIMCLALIVAAIPFMVACAKPPAPEAKTVKIGAFLPLNISFGVDIKEGLEASAEMVNQEGGLNVGGERYLIEYIIYDDKYQPDLGRAACERLIAVDNVVAIVGPAASAAVYASLPVQQQAGIPLFTSAHTEKLVDPSLKYVYATTTGRSTHCLYSLLLKAAPQIKMAVLASADHETGHELQAMAIKFLTHHGVQIVDKFYFPHGTKDYAPIATKMAAKNPDFFAMPGSGGSAVDQGLAMKAVADTGWKGEFFVTASPVVKDLYEICGAAAEGLYVPLTDYIDIPNPPKKAVELRRVFEEKFGYWKEVGPFWTLPFWFFKAAVEKAGSFAPDAIDKAMGEIGVIKTPLGDAMMMKRPDMNNHRYCDAIIAPMLAKVKGDKTVFIAGMSVEDAIKELEAVLGFKGQWK